MRGLSIRIEDETWKAIKKCAVLIKKVSHERILEEVNKILLSENPDYIRKLHECGLLQYMMPELERCFGEPQRNKYHIYDVGEHIMHTVKCTPNDLVFRRGRRLCTILASRVVRVRTKTV